MNRDDAGHAGKPGVEQRPLRPSGAEPHRAGSLDAAVADSAQRLHEQALQKREAAVADREGVATDREAVATDREAAATDREGVATDREAAATDREGVATDREGVATDREGAATDREDVATDREDVATDREGVARLREDAAGLREGAQRVVAEAQAEVKVRNSELRDANEHLVIATLSAKELTEAAELARRRQDEFLAMLAHELRNPLAAIRSAAALLARLDSTEPTLPLIREVIQRQVEHMARLLEDLLDASRVTSGKVNLRRRPTAVSEFVGQAVETSRMLIDAQHQQLTLDMPATPPYVDGDPVRLAQIVGNLLHNAMKYTQEGGAIVVSARRHGDTVVIRVSDNGIGIAAEALPHIFDLFRQDDRSLNRSQGGLGIGLTVVRSMVELHGGTVEARSGGLGQGSEFVVTLPRVEHAVERAVAPREDAPLTPTPARILLIDDNVDAGAVLAILLRLSGHEVANALDGPSALELFAQMRPQVVLCDIGLPGMSGYEVAAQMRERSQGPRPLMIALTGYNGPSDRDRALAAGFEHHLVKPADPEALLRLIDSALLAATPATPLP